MTSPAHWNGEIEDREHLRPPLLDVQVSDDGWGDSGVAGLPNPHQATRQQQEPEILTGGMWERRKERGEERGGRKEHAFRLRFTFNLKLGEPIETRVSFPMVP
jgi:hypothetical protein